MRGAHAQVQAVCIPDLHAANLFLQVGGDVLGGVEWVGPETEGQGLVVHSKGVVAAMVLHGSTLMLVEVCLPRQLMIQITAA